MMSWLARPLTCDGQIVLDGLWYSTLIGLTRRGPGAERPLGGGGNLEAPAGRTSPRAGSRPRVRPSPGGCWPNTRDGRLGWRRSTEGEVADRPMTWRPRRMPESPLRLVKRFAEFQPLANVKRVPRGR